VRNANLSRLIGNATLFAFLAVIPTAYAQVTTPSSLRDTQSEIERADPIIQQLIDRAESHFKQGKLNLDDNKLLEAREEFDKAVDTILESGIDVRSNPKLQTYYMQLVERVYREEVPTAQTNNVRVAQNKQDTTAPQKPQRTQIGFVQQEFTPSPLDELAKLKLTPTEATVTSDELETLEKSKNAINFKFQSNTLVQQFINYYQGRGRSTMENGLRRSGQFMAMARRIFREERVPEDIAWLGQVESSWSPRSRSRVGAQGLWQFMPGTGQRFGLQLSAWVDERNSFEKATRASARYLRWLADRYNGNWELAMAAYNTGEGNIDRAIARAGVADFAAIYPYIAQETRNYVPNILATIIIAKNPRRYGFDHIRPDPPMLYDVVRVPNATSLQLVANMTGTSVEYLRTLNPELRQNITPRGMPYELRVPPGYGRPLVAMLKRVPANMREMNARIITVAPNQTWEDVARNNGVNVEELKQMNNGVELKAGTKLVVPNSVRLTNKIYERNRPGSSSATGSSLQTVTARAGETLAQVAARFGASADEVAKLNGIAADAKLDAGKQILVPVKQASAPASHPARRRR
jgi:membrane-bound lytic murein transglycosylase D